MADVVDADELLRRIRVARDWARQEEEHAPDETTATAYKAVRQTLDKLIAPASG
ncbi:hypothetical protein QWM81_21445 [Streptomyces ficellus]|uniref:HEPN domain-containing protein n=1 Tax=Streptomyces ficellus TaxID=1977088 RepID=A0ABT7ZAM8_9ACTN|nr:hypothetical protein [Streptomyces ficellus]MDN3296567.1 hypothetical protein [Streptomyces ficellus]